VLLAPLLLAGCLNSILPKGGPAAVYTLVDWSGSPSCTAPSGTQASSIPGLLVETPRAIAPLDGAAISVLRSDGEFQVLPGARWAAPLPVLLQDLLARQLEHDCRSMAISQTARAHQLPLRLSSELRAFGLVERAGSLTARVTLSASLVCAADASVLAARQFSVELAADGSNANSISALRGAAATLAEQSSQWLSEQNLNRCQRRAD
jgi:ABC-type uncharacterized transport system auxiliary subunit